MIERITDAELEIYAKKHISLYFFTKYSVGCISDSPDLIKELLNRWLKAKMVVKLG